MRALLGRALRGEATLTSVGTPRWHSVTGAPPLSAGSRDTTKNSLSVGILNA
jgi:hypothetical protein